MSTDRLRLATVAVTVVALLALAGPATAHVELGSASPAENETVTTPLTEVRLEFTGPLTPGGDHAVGVFGPGDVRVDDGQTTETSERAITTGVGALPEAGPYTVQWLVIGADGHVIEGIYTFAYEGPVASPSPSPEPSPAASVEPSEEPQPQPSSSATAQPTSDEDGAGGTVPLALGLMGVAAAGAAVVVLRRRGSP